MPTYRKLHTKIIDSYDFSEMPNDFTRVFWMLLIVTVDSEGRAIDNPAWLKSKMFPLRNDVTEEQILFTQSWLSNRGMIVRYSVCGRDYFYIPKFKNYQSGTEREARSVLPNPTELTTNSGVNQEEITTNSTASVSVVVSDIASEGVKDRPNIFKVYEHEIGVLTASVADELELEEKENPVGWLEDAIKEAVLNNHRSLKYVQGILRNWRKEGRGEKSNGKSKKEEYHGPIILSSGEVVQK